jgi:hypothetical protein
MCVVFLKPILTLMIKFVVSGWNLITVESWFMVSLFKIFLYVVFNFWNPRKSPIYARHDFEFYPHLVDENLLYAWSLYPDLVFMQNLRTKICPTLLYACYCLFKVSIHLQLVEYWILYMGVEWPWETSRKEPLQAAYTVSSWRLC